MNRRSFLQFLGLAPVAPTVLAALPWRTFQAPGTFADFRLRKLFYIDYPEQTGDTPPTLGQWLELMEQNFPDEWLVSKDYLDEFDRISPPLRT